MPRYDASRYDPPAPVAIVTLRRSSGDGSAPDVPLLIDTGADITFLPRSAVGLLGIIPESGVRYELIGFDGTPLMPWSWTCSSVTKPSEVATC